MAKTIWKFKLSAEPIVELRMPAGAEILSVQSIVNIADPNPKELAYLWALVDESRKLQTRRIMIVPTGAEMGQSTSKSEYIGTLQMQSGDVILHVFEDIPF